MTEEVFKQCMAILGKNWPKELPTADQVSLYREFLADLHDSTLKAAIAACIKSCKFFPKIAEIRERAIATLELSGHFPPVAEVAWEEALDKARHWNWIDEVRYSDELVAQAVRAVGTIRRIAETANDDLGWLRKEFIEFYAIKREQELRNNDELLTLPARTHEDQLRGDEIRKMIGGVFGGKR